MVAEALQDDEELFLMPDAILNSVQNADSQCSHPAFTVGDNLGVTSNCKIDNDQFGTLALLAPALNSAISS